MSDILDERGKALEEEFFRKQNEKLIAKLRAEHQKEMRREQLRLATGITNAAILDSLIEQDVDASSFSVFALAPLIEVAWADGAIDEKERFAVLNAADEVGVKKGTYAHSLLDDRLAHRPGPEMMRAWINYTNELCAKLDAGAREALKKEVLGRARKIAEAAGGILTLSKRVSDAEAQVLARIEGAFPK